MQQDFGPCTMLLEHLAEWDLDDNITRAGVQLQPAVYHDVLGPPDNLKKGYQRKALFLYSIFTVGIHLKGCRVCHLMYGGQC